MNRSEYLAISFSLVFIFCFILIVVVTCMITRTARSFRAFMDGVVFIVLPGILKEKRDDNNQTVVYFRKERVLLEGGLLRKVMRALYFTCFFLAFYILSVTSQFLIIESSYECDSLHEDCFKLDGIDNHPVNCSDPKIADGSTPIVCYRLVFNLELAIGISYGMYKVSTTLLSIGTTLVMKLKSSRITCLKISVAVIGNLIIFGCIGVGFLPSHPLQKPSLSTLKIYFTVLCGTAIAFFFIFRMPWSDIIDRRDSQREPNEVSPLIPAVQI